MRIVIETVDHKDQRYETVGDWQTNSEMWHDDLGDGQRVPCDLLIRVSKMKDWRSEALVAVHELVEALLCRYAGITAEQVDAFDMGPGKELDEPGDDPRAPYHAQHKAAMEIERQLCLAFDLSWHEHEANVDGAGE